MPDFWILLLFDLLACHLFFPQQTEYSFCVSNQIYKMHFIILHCHTTFSPNMKVKHQQATQLSALTAAGINTLVSAHKCTHRDFFIAKTGSSCEGHFNGLWHHLPTSLFLNVCPCTAARPAPLSHISLSSVSFCIFTVNMAYVTVHLNSILDRLLHYMQIPSGFVLINKALNKEGGALLIPITDCIYILQCICTFPLQVLMYKELLVQLVWGSDIFTSLCELWLLTALFSRYGQPRIQPEGTRVWSPAEICRKQV